MFSPLLSTNTRSLACLCSGLASGYGSGRFYSHRRSSIAVRSKSSASTRNTRARNFFTAFAAH